MGRGNDGFTRTLDNTKSQHQRWLFFCLRIAYFYTKVKMSEIGLYKGPSHAEGGIDVLVDGHQPVEVEGQEYKICTEAYNSPEILSFTDKTNLDVLNYIHQQFSCKFEQNKADGGDFILCKLVVKDPKRYNRKGTVKQILDEMQNEKSCRLSTGNLGEGGKAERGGKLTAKPAHPTAEWKMPDKDIYEYAQNIKDNHPEIWSKGGNIYGNTAFKKLAAVIKRGYWLKSEEWFYKKWQAFGARHAQDKLLPGVVANLKWLFWVNRGKAYSKEVINHAIKTGKGKMEDGGSFNHYITKYEVTLHSPNDMRVIYFGTDEQDALNEYKWISASDIPEGFYDVVKILQKQTNEYKFVGQLDEGEAIEDYPLEDYADDEEYWKLVQEGDWKEVAAEGVKTVKEEQEEEESARLKELRADVEEYITSISSEQKYAAFMQSTYYALIPYLDGFIQVRVADHHFNMWNIRLGKEVCWDCFDEPSMRKHNQYRNIYGFLSINIIDSNYSDRRGYRKDYKDKREYAKYPDLIRSITYDVSISHEYDSYITYFKDDINSALEEIREDVNLAIADNWYDDERRGSESVYMDGGSIAGDEDIQYRKRESLSTNSVYYNFWDSNGREALVRLSDHDASFIRQQADFDLPLNTPIETVLRMGKAAVKDKAIPNIVFIDDEVAGLVIDKVQYGLPFSGNVISFKNNQSWQLHTFEDIYGVKVKDRTRQQEADSQKYRMLLSQLEDKGLYIYVADNEEGKALDPDNYPAFVSDRYYAKTAIPYSEKGNLEVHSKFPHERFRLLYIAKSGNHKLQFANYDFYKKTNTLIPYLDFLVKSNVISIPADFKPILPKPYVEPIKEKSKRLLWDEYDKINKEINKKTNGMLKQHGLNVLKEKYADRFNIAEIESLLFKKDKIYEQIVALGKSDANSKNDTTNEAPPANFKKGGNLLLAPNGKPSNLTPEQYRLVRTPEFKAWFGDWENDPANASKVVDENGEPLVVYHGSPKYEMFYKFRRGSKGYLGGGIYFTSDKNSAQKYAQKYGGGNLYQVFLYITTPLTVTGSIGADDLLRKVYKTDTIYRNRSSKQSFDTMIVKRSDINKIEQYYDGIIWDTADEYVVWQPNQIKLADGSNTTFDATNPDIRFEKGGSAAHLLAPNGKPSNLTPEQYRLVRTPQFKTWFGDWETDPANASKVVDENGEPLVVYHGTKSRFFVFDRNMGGQSNTLAKVGFWFTAKKAFAENFAWQAYWGKDDEAIYSVFLNIKNPKIYTTNFTKDYGDSYEQFHSDIYKLEGKKEWEANIAGIGMKLENPEQTIDNYRQLLSDEGYDGIIIKETRFDKRFAGGLNTQYVALFSSQIKLADGTNTTFDATTPDIRFEKGGSAAHLLAPNGKPSNLTPEQYRLVRTPEFKAWFGDWEKYRGGGKVSRVIDENGEPLVVWHGSASWFNEFDRTKLGKEQGATPTNLFGFFFSDNKKVAHSFQRHSMETANMNEGSYEYHQLKKYGPRPYFLNIRHAKVLDLSNKGYETAKDEINELALKIKDKPYFDGMVLLRYVDSMNVNPLASNQYVIRHSQQAKLADGSNTTFDAASPDIRFEKGGSADFIKIDLSELTTSLKDFQGRAEAYSSQTYNRIANEVAAGTFNFTALPPIQIWKDPRTGKYVILAGHSRTAAFTDLAAGKLPVNKKYKPADFKAINAQIVKAESLAEAQKIAQESNAGAVQTDIENAAYARKLRAEIKNLGEYHEKLKTLFGKNWVYVNELSYLYPDGKAMNMLKSLQSLSDKTQSKTVEDIASYLGAARKALPQLTNAHENELYDWLTRNIKNPKADTKQEFLALINSRVSRLDFNAADPLNMDRVGAKTYIEENYDQQVFEKEQLIAEKQKQLNDERKRYLAAGLPIDEVEEKLDPLEKYILRLQRELLILKQNKGQVAEQSKTILGLFDTPAPKTREQQHEELSAKMLVLYDLIQKQLHDMQAEPKPSATGNAEIDKIIANAPLLPADADVFLNLRVDEFNKLLSEANDYYYNISTGFEEKAKAAEREMEQLPKRSPERKAAKEAVEELKAKAEVIKAVWDSEYINNNEKLSTALKEYAVKHGLVTQQQSEENNEALWASVLEDLWIEITERPGIENNWKLKTGDVFKGLIADYLKMQEPENPWAEAIESAEWECGKSEEPVCQKYINALKTDDKEVLREFHQYGEPGRPAIRNYLSYLNAKQFGYTEFSVNDSGWYKQPPWIQEKMVNFKTDAKERFPKNYVTLAQGPNGKWAYGKNINIGNSGEGYIPSASHSTAYATYEEALMAALSEMENRLKTVWYYKDTPIAQKLLQLIEQERQSIKTTLPQKSIAQNEMLKLRPTVYRMDSGNRYLTYKFNPLTGKVEMYNYPENAVAEEPSEFYSSIQGNNAYMLSAPENSTPFRSHILTADYNGKKLFQYSVLSPFLLDQLDWWLSQFEQYAPQGEKHTYHYEPSDIKKKYGYTDVEMLKQLVETAIHLYTDHLIATHTGMEATYQAIVNFYNQQPAIKWRSSNSLLLQQYSTAIPLAYLMSKWCIPIVKFADNYLEPSAGTGLLTIGTPPAYWTVNELDKERLTCLRFMGFKKALNLNSNMPLPVSEKFDAILTNPPFGSDKAENFDGYAISKLEHRMAAFALKHLANNGRAGIIIGGNTQYNENGFIEPYKTDRVFLAYLYKHYNVVDVINLSGFLYNKMGAVFPIRMILIDGHATEASAKHPPFYKDIEQLPASITNSPHQVKDWPTFYQRILHSFKPDY